jgi:hypothetical protein
MDELEKIYQDFIQKRITTIRPDYSASIMSGGVSPGMNQLV